MMKTVHLSFISYICALFQPTKSDCCQMTDARLGFKKTTTKKPTLFTLLLDRLITGRMLLSEVEDMFLSVGVKTLIHPSGFRNPVLENHDRPGFSGLPGRQPFHLRSHLPCGSLGGQKTRRG